MIFIVSGTVDTHLNTSHFLPLKLDCVPCKPGSLITDHGINTIDQSSVLKLYFRLLPTPLVTYDLYPHLVLASKQSEPRRGEKFREILARLPGAHYRWERNRKHFVLDLISCPAEQWTG